ncbi:hypothetical protein D3C75_1290730 [compost metagenome]
MAETEAFIHNVLCPLRSFIPVHTRVIQAKEQAVAKIGPRPFGVIEPAFQNILVTCSGYRQLQAKA